MPYKNKEDRIAYAKKYREQHREYFRAAYSKWAKENPSKQVERQSKYLSDNGNKLKASARGKVWYAIKTGRIVRPDKCSQCLIQCKPEADHSDYTQPYNVVWLCKSCHTHITIKRKQVY